MSQFGEVLGSCTLSYIVISILRIMFGKSNVYGEAIVSAIVCVGIMYIWLGLTRNKNFRNFLINKFKYSPSVDTWDSVLDQSETTVVRVKLKGCNYYVIGVIVSHGDTNENPWFALNNYCVYKLDDNSKPVRESNEDGDYFVFNVNDIEIMEAFNLDE